MKTSTKIKQITELALQAAVDQAPSPPDAAWVRQHLMGATIEPEAEVEPWKQLPPYILQLLSAPVREGYAKVPIAVRTTRARFAVPALVVHSQVKPTENDVAAVEILSAYMKESSLTLHIRMPDEKLSAGKTLSSLTMLAYPDGKLIDTFTMSDLSPLSEHTLTTTLPPGLAESWPELLRKASLKEGEAPFRLILHPADWRMVD